MENKVYSITMRCKFCQSIDCIHVQNCCFNISSKVDDVLDISKNYYPKNVYSSLIGCDTLPATASFICQDYQIVSDEDLLKIIEDRIKEDLLFGNYSLNPDVSIVNGIKKGLLKKYKKFGDFYCPCKLDNSEKNICPCDEREKEIEMNGKCHCGLYVNKKVK